MREARESVVETAAGELSGYAVRGGFAFKGIPYGECMTGELRFRPPIKRTPWRGIRDATQPGPICFQTNSDFEAWRDPTTPSEDCLVLNIWTPSTDERAGCPVMVWIHGGAYTNGSGGLEIYDGALLSEAEHVVVVSINHRLNIFGYLFVGDLAESFADSANLGQQDLVLALQWVRDNIRLFGGDPANITLFGESGGGGKISALLAMPSAHGLFSRAIIQSGWLLNVLSREQAAGRARLVQRVLGLEDKNLERLRFLPAGLLRTAEATVLRQVGYGAFFPVADGTILPAMPWIEPTNLAAPVPLLIGTTLDEGAYFIPERLFARPPAGAALAKEIAKLCSPVPISADESQWLLHEYGLLNSSGAGLPALLQILTDILFQGNAVFQAAQQALRAPVYMYRFDWQTPCFGGLYAAHAVDIPFVFGTLDYSQPAFGTQDSAVRRAEADPLGIRYELSRTVQRAWAAFARKGSPGHSGLPDWPNYDENNRATLILDSRCRLEVDPLPERRKLAAQMKVPGRKLATVS